MFKYWLKSSLGWGRRFSTSERECFVTKEGLIGIINLNRPSRKNAFGKVMISQVQESLHSISRDQDLRVVIIRSLVDRCFSAGADLKERAEMPASQVSSFVDTLRNTFTMLEDLPIPSIAAIDGVALGGGLELALCCDIRYAGMNAKMGLPETKLAILPAAGGSQRLPRLIGTSKAKELIFTAAILNSNEALSYGIVNDSISNGLAFDKALEQAQKICANGPLAVRYAKEAITNGMKADLKTGLKIEQLCYAQLIPTEDRLEGLAAFKEGRTPNYKGK